MKKTNLVTAVLFLVLLLMGCTSRAEILPTPIQVRPTQTSTVEQVPNTPIPTDTLVPAPTHTPEPTNTKTAKPTKTPTPTLAPPEIDPALKTWLQENAIPFDTTAPGSGFDDLQPLVTVIGDARIVALGEATHGTHEFNQLRHRLLEFLVQEMDFNIFAVEGSWADARLVDHYIQTGEGKPQALLAELEFWTLQTQEMLDLVEWMRQYNLDLAPEDRIHFAGFDMQLYDRALDDISQFIDQGDPGISSEAIAKLNCVRGLVADYDTLPAEDRDACRTDLQAVYDLLQENETVFLQSASPDEFAFALQSMRVVQQAEMMYGNQDFGPLRDSFMAENIAWLLEHYGPDAKVVAWGHNLHVSAYPNGGFMGSFLSTTFGEAFVSVGFEFSRGQFIAMDRDGSSYGALKKFAAPLFPEGSMADLLRAAEMPMFVLDMHAATEGVAAEWLSAPSLFHNIGAVYEVKCPNAYAYSVIPAETWDVLIYFENTTAAQHLDGAPPRSNKPATENITLGPTNLDFEAGTKCWHLPADALRDYQWEIDKSVAHTGENSLTLRSFRENAAEAYLWQRADIDGLQGKTIRLTVALRANDLEGQVVLYVDEGFHFTYTSYEHVVDSAPLSGPSASEWITEELVVDLSEEASHIGFGVKLQGNGQIWVDDFTIEVVDP